MVSMCGCISALIIAGMISGLSGCNNVDTQETVTLPISTNTEIAEQFINKEGYIINYCISRDKDGNKVSVYNKGQKITIISKLSNNKYKINTDEYVDMEHIETSDTIFIDDNGLIIRSVKPDGIINADSDIPNNLINYAYNYWYLIPDNIRSQFKNDGWSIVITTKSLSEEVNTDYEIIGLTLPDIKQIKIIGTQKAIRESLIHEVGHYVDISLADISKTPEFSIIYNSIRDELLDNTQSYSLAEFNEREAFAEMFEYYYIDDIRIKTLLSKQYEQLMSLIKY